MEILICKRCGEVWCYRGTGRALRCGKCKSPYWDRERVSETGNISRRQIDSGDRSKSGRSDRVHLPTMRIEVDAAKAKPDPVSTMQEGGLGAKICRSCEGPLRVVKGKLVCCKVDCPDIGYAQGNA